MKIHTAVVLALFGLAMSPVAVGADPQQDQAGMYE